MQAEFNEYGLKEEDTMNSRTWFLKELLRVYANKNGTPGGNSSRTPGGRSNMNILA